MTMPREFDHISFQKYYNRYPAKRWTERKVTILLCHIAPVEFRKLPEDFKKALLKKAGV